MMRPMPFLSSHAASPRAVAARAARYFRTRSPRYLAGFTAVALSLLVLCLPSGYSTEWPGPTRDVLGTVRVDGERRDMIEVEGIETHEDTGRLLLVTISANGVPGYPVTNAEVLFAWLMPDRVVTPREAVVPAGQTVEQYRKKSAAQMSGAQRNAVKAAESFLTGHGYDVDGMEASMSVDDIGGPSAGMMYALGLIDKVTPERETGGETVAGTGTIDADGEVGAIGGVRLKMRAALRDGAAWFLAPASNCDEVVGHVPEGLRDVKVSTLQEAYEALVAIGEGHGDSLARCAVE